MTHQTEPFNEVLERGQRNKDSVTCVWMTRQELLDLAQIVLASAESPTIRKLLLHHYDLTAENLNGLVEKMQGEVAGL